MGTPKQVTIEYHTQSITEDGVIFWGIVYREAKVDGRRLQGTTGHSAVKLGPYSSRNQAYRRAVRLRKRWAKADYMGVPISEVR